MRKTLEQKIEANRLEMERLQKEQNVLIAEQEEKENQARAVRHSRRGDYVEKHFPELIKLTERQFYTFVEKTLLTPHTRKILTELTAESATPPADPKPPKASAQPAVTPSAKDA